MNNILLSVDYISQTIYVLEPSIKSYNNVYATSRSIYILYFFFFYKSFLNVTVGHIIKFAANKVY